MTEWRDSCDTLDASVELMSHEHEARVRLQKAKCAEPAALSEMTSHCRIQDMANTRSHCSSLVVSIGPLLSSRVSIKALWLLLRLPQRVGGRCLGGVRRPLRLDGGWELRGLLQALCGQLGVVALPTSTCQPEGIACSFQFCSCALSSGRMPVICVWRGVIPADESVPFWLLLNSN